MYQYIERKLKIDVRFEYQDRLQTYLTTYGQRVHETVSTFSQSSA